MTLEYWLIIYFKKKVMKKEKKTINILTTFFFHKNCFKIFLKLIINHYLKTFH